MVVLIEHVLLFLKYWLENLVPRIPGNVVRALERDRFIEAKRRENHRKRLNLGCGSSPSSPIMREGKEMKKPTEQGVGGGKTIARNYQGCMSPSLVHNSGDQLPHLLLSSPLSSPATDTPLLSPSNTLESPRFLSPSRLEQVDGSEGTRRRHHWERPEMNYIGFNEHISAECNVLESETDTESSSGTSSSSSDSETDRPGSPGRYLN